VRLPVSLQQQFFEIAKDEAAKIRLKLLQDAERLKALKTQLTFSPISPSNDWEEWRIASVDGSDSPQLSERIGARYGTYASGYMIFEGGEVVEEEYTPGILTLFFSKDPDNTEKIMRLLTVKMERDAAVRCLKEKDVDLILIDGSFFGFRAGCNMLRNTVLGLPQFKRVADLIDDICAKSILLSESAKAVGVVKRVRTSAIDGWAVYQSRSQKTSLDRNDKGILSTLMPAGTVFGYDTLFPSPEDFNYFNLLRSVLNRREYDSMETALAEAKRGFVEGVKANLHIDPAPLLNIHRYFHRPYPHAPPYCLEVHRNFEIGGVVAYLQSDSNCNPATGLPFPIDLIDENVSLPIMFTKEFVEEIEAQLIADPQIDKLDLSGYFTGINPQKEEGA